MLEAARIFAVKQVYALPYLMKEIDFMCIKPSLFPSISNPSLLCLYSVLLTAIMMACGGKPEKNPVKVTKVKYVETSALNLIRKDDCLSCHSIEDKSVGPAYIKIAERYEADDATFNKLADKIIEGGGGLWGGMMTKHPYLKKEDAMKIVGWVLSLDDSLANPDPMIHTPGISLAGALNEDGRNTENGLKVKVYALKSLDDNGAGFPVIDPETVPLYSGIIPKIHFPGEESFSPLSEEDFALQITGSIHIKTKGKYFFKQVRTGKGRVFLNGEKKINESEWDSEAPVDLSPGVYSITVEYLPEKGNRNLSLQWITPDREYYEVIPEEVFTYQVN